MTRVRVPSESAGRVAGTVLGIASAISLAAFGRFAYLGLTGQRRFVTLVDVALYYLVPFLAAVLLFGSRRLPALGKLRAVMSLLAFIAALYATDGALALSNRTSVATGPLREGQLKPVMTVLAQSQNRKRYAADLAATFGRPIDARTPAQVVADFREKGIDAERIITASNQLFISQPDGSVESAVHIDGREVVPLGGVSNKRTLVCNESGQWIDLPSDRHGFNNPDEVWQLARMEIAVLGDSFTQGYCVPSGRSFADLIRQQRPATLNLGISGDGPLLELATLEEFLPKLTPKIVLWFYYEGNDLTDLQTERKSAVLMKYLNDGFSQQDLDRQADIDRAMLAEVPRLDFDRKGELPQQALGSDTVAIDRVRQADRPPRSAITDRRHECRRTADGHRSGHYQHGRVPARDGQGSTLAWRVGMEHCISCTCPSGAATPTTRRGVSSSETRS